MQKISRTIMFMAALLLLATSVNVQVVSANTGAIWTTTGSCGTPQNVNHYVTGAQVYINGENFTPGDLLDYEIKGQPGQASTTPGVVVADGTITVEQDGTFCVMAHVISALEGGTYQVKVGNKGDNYRVEQVIEPEDPIDPEDPIEPEDPPVASVPSQPVVQSTPAPVVAPTTGASSGPATLVISAASALGLSGLSLGAWLKRRKI